MRNSAKQTVPTIKLIRNPRWRMDKAQKSDSALTALKAQAQVHRFKIVKAKLIVTFWIDDKSKLIMERTQSVMITISRQFQSEYLMIDLTEKFLIYNSIIQGNAYTRTSKNTAEASQIQSQSLGRTHQILAQEASCLRSKV
jgi:hypothetical protein